MNVLNNSFCDTSLISHNFKESYPQNKIISDISSKQGSLHMLNTVSQISLDRPLSSMTHSSPDIHLFNSSGQIQIPNGVDNGFEDRNDVSVFSDQFPEIVPSWLTHDFMKVSSENLPSPNILSNVSDIYPSPRETEHFVMLDLGFPPELNSQDVVPNDFNGSIDNQKLLDELPMQRFSNNESLLMSSFNDINSMQYSKFKQNVQLNDPSIMSTVLPCDNDLLHIPLHANLSEQCLTTSSPSMLPSSQSQSHPVDVVCGKLPQINLNHLDSFLGSESSLSEIQLLRQDFSLPVEVNSNQLNQSCLNNCNPTHHGMSCPSTVFLNSSVPPLPQTQDASVQVTENIMSERVVGYGNCFPCSKVSLGIPIEVTRCFKCKFCDFVNIHKCAVESHINSVHSNAVSSFAMVRSEASQSGQTSYVTNSTIANISSSNQGHLVSSNSTTVVSNSTNYSSNINKNLVIPTSVQKKQVQCIRCSRIFSEVNAYESHLMSEHNINLRLLHLNNVENNALSYPLVPTSSSDNSNLNRPSLNASSSHESINTKLRPIKSKEGPKQTEETSKKATQRKGSNTEAPPNSEKAISSHKKAWRRKIRRELGSYICEFKNCNVRFRALDNLEYHKKCHADGGSTFACPECGETFENWGNVAGHLWRTHKNDMELHACDQCPFRTYSLSRLENLHKRIHRDEYLFLCDTCGKSFKTGKQLRTHRVRHEKEKSKSPSKRNSPPEFKCKLCQMNFLSKVMLLNHEEAVHNKKRKRFMCSHCDFFTLKLSTLHQHTRVHTGEKPFACKNCDYRTSDHNSLRRHEMRHSGEKKYKCPYCNYSSIQACAYKVHMKKHPEQVGVLFSCELCSFQTLKEETYKQHKQEHECMIMLQNSSCSNEMSATENTFPLAEAMDISLSYSDDFLLSQFSKKNPMQSFFNNLDSNVLVCQESAR